MGEAAARKKREEGGKGERERRGVGEERSGREEEELQCPFLCFRSTEYAVRRNNSVALHALRALDDIVASTRIPHQLGLRFLSSRSLFLCCVSHPSPGRDPESRMSKPSRLYLPARLPRRPRRAPDSPPLSSPSARPHPIASTPRDSVRPRLPRTLSPTTGIAFASLPYSSRPPKPEDRDAARSRPRAGWLDAAAFAAARAAARVIGLDIAGMCASSISPTTGRLRSRMAGVDDDAAGLDVATPVRSGASSSATSARKRARRTGISGDASRLRRRSGASGRGRSPRKHATLKASEP